MSLRVVAPRPSADHTVTHNGALRTIRDYLAALGGWEVKLLGGLGQKAGCPDLVACIPDKATGIGHFVAVEVKTGTATLTATQAEQKALIERALGVYIVAADVDGVEDRLVAEGLAVPSVQRRRRR